MQAIREFLLVFSSVRTRSRSVLPAFPCNVDVCKRKAARPRAIEAPGSRERGSSRRIAIRRRERLCFEGAPQILPPLAQDAAKRVPEPIESEAVNSRRVTPPLTEYDRHRVVEAKTASTNALTKAATEIRVRTTRSWLTRFRRGSTSRR